MDIQLFFVFEETYLPDRADNEYPASPPAQNPTDVSVSSSMKEHDATAGNVLALHSGESSSSVAVLNSASGC